MFLGFEMPAEGQDPAAFPARAEDLLAGLGTAFLVHSAGEVRLEV